MQITNSALQINNSSMEQILPESQKQGSDLAEKLMKMNVVQQIDQSQLSYMATLVDLCV